jgi:hypothetical protein
VSSSSATTFAIASRAVVCRSTPSVSSRIVPEESRMMYTFCLGGRASFVRSTPGPDFFSTFSVGASLVLGDR